MSFDSYWTVSYGIACRNGWSCRECKQAIVINSPLVCRDGRRTRLYYHPDCFSGVEDPRSQTHSSAQDDRFKNVISKTAPMEKGRGKWSTGCYGTKSQGVLWKK